MRRFGKEIFTKCDVYCNSVPALSDFTNKSKISETAISCLELCYNNQQYICLKLLRVAERENS